MVNPKVSISQISLGELRRIFLGQNRSFPDGSAALPVNTLGWRRQNFYQRVLLRTPEQMERYWARMVLVGDALPPRELEAGDVRAMVAKTPGAIAYLDRSEVNASVRALKVLR